MMYNQVTTEEGRTLMQGMPCRLLLWTGATAVAMLISTGCLTQGGASSQEEQAQEIDRSLICPICPGETIDQSQVEQAKQMRAIVREKLAAGESRQEILDYFVESFGEDILAAPPKSGFNILVWTMPVVGILAGGVTLLLVLRAMHRRRGIAEDQLIHPSTTEELEPYLSRVDDEMQQVLGRGHPREPSLPSERQSRD